MSDTAIEHTEYSRNAKIPKIFKKDEPPRVIQQTLSLKGKTNFTMEIPKVKFGLANSLLLLPNSKHPLARLFGFNEKSNQGGSTLKHYHQYKLEQLKLIPKLKLLSPVKY